MSESERKAALLDAIVAAWGLSPEHLLFNTCGCCERCAFCERREGVFEYDKNCFHWTGGVCPERAAAEAELAALYPEASRRG